MVLFIYSCDYENNQQDALYKLVFYSKSALRVFGDVFTHHQEHLTVFIVEPTWSNKSIYIVHLVGYFHSCITMHGFMNFKFTHGYLATFKVHRLYVFQAKVTRHLFHLERAVTLFSVFYHFSFLVATHVLIIN
jgi:hypothetical protein